MAEYIYLLNLTFYAGSNAEEDTDRETFFVKCDEPLTEDTLEDMLKEANEWCESGWNDASLYDDGFNIDTLVNCFNENSVHCTIGKPSFPAYIINMYDIEIWG